MIAKKLELKFVSTVKISKNLYFCLRSRSLNSYTETYARAEINYTFKLLWWQTITLRLQGLIMIMTAFIIKARISGWWWFPQSDIYCPLDSWLAAAQVSARPWKHMIEKREIGKIWKSPIKRKTELLGTLLVQKYEDLKADQSEEGLGEKARARDDVVQRLKKIITTWYTGWFF